jgi:polyisoprenoid-binding protein YceI
MRFQHYICALVPAVAAFTGIADSTWAENYAIDPAHSSVVFRIKHSDLNYVYGMFPDVKGHFTVDESGEVDVTIGADSVNTGNRQRDQHLRSPDFFNSRQFPQITFKSSEVKNDGDNTVEITGEVEMLGESRPITAKATTATGTGRGGEAKGGLVAEFEVKRSDFQLGGRGGISDEVTITVSLQGTKQ